MRTTARIAMMITGAAVLVVVLATPGAQSDRRPAERRDGDAVELHMGITHSRPQSPDTRGKLEHAEARFPMVPRSASANRADEGAAEMAVADMAAGRRLPKLRTIAEHLVFDAHPSEQGGPSKDRPDLRQHLVRSLTNACRGCETMSDPAADRSTGKQKPAPIILQFQPVVININLSGLGW